MHNLIESFIPGWDRRHFQNTPKGLEKSMGQVETPFNTSSRCSLHRWGFGRVLGALLCLLNTTVDSLCSSLEAVMVTIRLLSVFALKKCVSESNTFWSGGLARCVFAVPDIFLGKFFFFFFERSAFTFHRTFIMDVSSALEAHQNKL
jgi:hypothetical protein